MDAKRLYWKTLATIASWLILAGFLTFPLAFEGQQGELQASRAALLTLAVSLTSFGYLIPCFSSSLLGLFNSVINIAVRNLQPLGQVTIVALALSAISTVCYGAAALYHLMSFDKLNIRGRKKKNSLWSDDGTALLSEDDMQRQQLRNLLKQTSNRSPSPEISQNTFRIDLPGEDTSSQRGRSERYLTLPQNTYSRSSSKTPSITIEESPPSWEMNNLRPYESSGHNRSSSWGL
ncbi:hypothetical protein FQN54_001122 [Arachnomyces sp. PD_36]|nr:hypothetical protein FQN54_001122 [Arachnomyces sp. PD_36]